MNEKDQYYIAGKMFDSLEKGLAYEKEWLESIADQETFERLWGHLGKEISMNIFLLGRQIPVKDLKLILEDIFSSVIIMLQEFNIKNSKNYLECFPTGSEIQVGPTTPIEFMPIPDIYPIYTE